MVVQGCTHADLHTHPQPRAFNQGAVPGQMEKRATFGVSELRGRRHVPRAGVLVRIPGQDPALVEEQRVVRLPAVVEQDGGEPPELVNGDVQEAPVPEPAHALDLQRRGHTPRL